MQILFPTGEFISPGPQQFQTVRFEEREVWHMGHLISEDTIEIHGVLNTVVPEPQPGCWDIFEIADRKFFVARNDCEDFWGPGGKDGFLSNVVDDNEHWIKDRADASWWDLDAQGTPQRVAIKISIQDMLGQNKTLMAHLLVDLGVFKSVSEAKRNGWDRALEPGRHELGPKKKRIVVEIQP
jgi:hypothetical protein